MTQDINFGAGDHLSLFELEAASFWVRRRNQLLLWALGHYFGSGPGRYLEAAGVERGCIQGGLDFPLGGSLLAIARKP